MWRGYWLPVKTIRVHRISNPDFALSIYNLHGFVVFKIKIKKKKE